MFSVKVPNDFKVQAQLIVVCVHSVSRKLQQQMWSIFCVQKIRNRWGYQTVSRK